MSKFSLDPEGASSTATVGAVVAGKVELNGDNLKTPRSYKDALLEEKKPVGVPSSRRPSCETAYCTVDFSCV